MKRFVYAIIIFMLIAPGLHAEVETGTEMNRKGLQMLREKQFGRAEKMFIRAVSINPENKYYLNNLAVSQIKQGKYKYARVNLLKALAIDQGYVKAVSNLAVVSFYLREYYRAYHYYRTAKSLDREYIENRFDEKRVQQKLERLHRENPGNEEYRRLYIQFPEKK